MKKKIVTFLLALTIFLTGISCQGFETKAQDAGEDIDYSYLMTDSALVGYAELKTRGVYLLSGESIINKISSTKIGAGGITDATMKCKVSVVPIVERLDDGVWEYVTSWNVTNESAYSAMASRSITVGTGYYYRVRSLHYASSDSSSSWTNGLWI